MAAFRSALNRTLCFALLLAALAPAPSRAQQAAEAAAATPGSGSVPTPGSLGGPRLAQSATPTESVRAADGPVQGDAAPEGRTRLRYQLDPVSDTVLTSVALVVGLGSEATIRSGELQAQPPAGTENILVLDRWVAEADEAREGASLFSDMGVVLTIGYAVADTVRSGYRDGPSEGWTEFLMYLQSGLFNWSAANIVKLTVRRPRPIVYIQQRNAEAAGEDLDLDDTNRELSFYSAHTSVTAGLVGTAAYMAFERNPDGLEPWLVVGVGSVLTGFVGVQRVLNRSHFPSDVIVGAVIGGALGIMIPHLHVITDESVQLGLAPWNDGAGAFLSYRH
ncbi:MAG: phosphatase PAP2 family protein [Myxococcales bacterium]|nr:phosphatase PAP2 family protein [Myxococcales bacterium]